MEKEQLMWSERIGVRLIMDIERLSNKKLRNGWKRIEKAVDKENKRCKEWIAYNPECMSNKEEMNMEKPKPKCEEAEKRLLSSKTQCIKWNGTSLTALNWRRRFESKDEWGCRNPNTGIGKWLRKEGRDNTTKEQEEKQSGNEEDGEREDDSVSVLSRSWDSNDSASLSLEMCTTSESSKMMSK